MSYSDLYFQQRSRPSRILIAFALIAVVSGAIFFFTSQTTPTRASKKSVTQQEIVNLTPHQAGIFWEPEVPDEGWILYGTTPNKVSMIALDVQDLEARREKRPFHYVLLKNLDPDTTYYYKIVSNNELIAQSDNSPFEVTTGPQNGSSGLLTPAYGKVALASGEAAKHAFVMLKVPEARPLLAITGNTGEWLIPLQYFVSKNKSIYIIANNETPAEITIFNATQKSKLNVELLNSHPIPQTTVLGENYNYLNATSSAVLGSKTTKSQASATNNFNVTIRYPRNGSVIPGTAPLIKGSGVPGKIVTATIDSRPAFSVNVAVDRNGDWTVPVTRTFLPGKYILTIKTENTAGKVVELTSKYTLIKSGEQVLGESVATPAGTINPSPTSAVATPTPVGSTEIPTEIPTPTAVGSDSSDEVTPTPPPPVSGTENFMPYIFTGGGLIIVGAGLLLVL